MEIEVGDYVRLKSGIIGQVVQITNYSYVIRINNGAEYAIGSAIRKHSKNIIDLIEVEDYVNGYKIIAINYKENYITIQNINEFDENGIKVLQEDEIKTILTKEQMEANCYTVERKEEC